MKKQLAATLTIIIIPLFFVSCISSLLKDKAPSFSTEITLVAPPKPFIKTDTSVFPSWKNNTTGNVISIVSDCNENSSYKLSNLHQLIENELDGINVIKEETTSLQKRPALIRVINAHLDGQPIEIQSLSFKRKSCGYVATLSGKINNLASDKSQFEKFVNSFGFK
ncbi:MAG: hypothetical protein AABY53_02770 [Bdellovibrionota bacterium]